jgi:hypothetical protein
VVRGVRLLGPDAKAIELEVLDAPLGFCGGQYIIVDSGLVLPTGKAVKRAYSPVSADRDQRRLELWVMRIADGPGSDFVHGLDVGRPIAFSGPWGRLYPQDGASGRTLIVATDTGITAALGLVCSQRMAPLLGGTALVWLRQDPGYFVREEEVRSRLPDGIGAVRFGLLPPIGDPARLPVVRGVVAELGGTASFARGFSAGDGHVNYGLLDDLVAAGIPATRENVESFFNMPKRSAPATAAP